MHKENEIYQLRVSNNEHTIHIAITEEVMKDPILIAIIQTAAWQVVKMKEITEPEFEEVRV